MTLVAEVRVLTELPSLANGRGHWAKKARIVKAHRNLGAWIVVKAFGSPSLATRWASGACSRGQRVRVEMTRIAPRALDSDNLHGCFKGIRDGIAEALSVNDGGELVRWEPTQEKGAPKERALRVRFFVENGDK